MELEVELELDLELEMELEAGVGVGAETMESSEIPPGGPKIRIIFVPNASFWLSLKGNHLPAVDFGATFQDRKILYSLPATGHTINTLTAGLPSKMHFKRTLWDESGSRPPHFH